VFRSILDNKLCQPIKLLYIILFYNAITANIRRHNHVL